MTEAGHSVLRLPPYHPDLNPIELVWASLKQYVAERNVDFNFKHVEKYCDELFSTFSKEDWKKKCEHAISYERYFTEKEPFLDVIVEYFIINFQEDSDSDNAESIEDLSSDSEVNFQNCRHFNAI
nr:unnamed protein product [Callosobruchus chinensis]